MSWQNSKENRRINYDIVIAEQNEQKYLGVTISSQNKTMQIHIGNAMKMETQLADMTLLDNKDTIDNVLLE